MVVTAAKRVRPFLSGMLLKKGRRAANDVSINRQLLPVITQLKIRRELPSINSDEQRHLTHRPYLQIASLALPLAHEHVFFALTFSCPKHISVYFIYLFFSNGYSLYFDTLAQIYRQTKGAERFIDYRAWSM